VLMNPAEYLESVVSRKQLVFFDKYFIQYIEHLVATQSLQTAFDTFRLLLTYKLKQTSPDFCFVFQLSFGGRLPSSPTTLQLPDVLCSAPASWGERVVGFVRSYLLYQFCVAITCSWICYQFYMLRRDRI
jgi:hypothetical protein